MTPRLAVVGVPRTAHTLEESVLRAQLRGFEVVLVDTPAAIAAVPRRLGVRGTPVETMDAPTVAAALRGGFSAPSEGPGAGISTAPEGPGFSAPSEGPGAGISTVVSFSELHLITAARVRELLGLPGGAPVVEQRTRDKAETRRQLRAAGLSGVEFAVTDVPGLRATAERFTAPFVVKPVDLTGSIGVRVVRTGHDLDAVHAMHAAGPDARRLLVESFIAGREYSVEGICVGGAFYLLAVTRKYTSGFPYCYEVAHLLPDPIREQDARIETYLRRVTSALGIDTAPVHAEVMVSPGGVELVEIHTRFGGDLIPLLLDRAFDIHVFDLFYAALTADVVPVVPPARRTCAVLFLEEKQTAAGLTLPPPLPGVEYQVRLHPSGDPQTLAGLPIVNRRTGYVLIEADRLEDAENALHTLRRDTETK